MHHLMNNTDRTTDQGYRNCLPPIQSILDQHSDMVLDSSNQSRDTQECQEFLIASNGTTNNSDFMPLSTYGIYSFIKAITYRQHPTTDVNIVNLVDHARCRHPGESHIYLTNTNERQSNSPRMVFSQQFDITTSKQIQIKSQPRWKYHPRTPKESEKVAHYIRCEKGEGAEYPTIYTICNWKSPSRKNYIEVALVDMRNLPHPYTIDNKEGKLYEGEPLVVRSADKAPNILYFRLTDEDFDNGYKTFKIELIKSKQDDNITKQLIRERELGKSKLCFTRTFYDENDSYHRDEASTVYSCVMTESYGDISVEHINPVYGPMDGNQLLDVVFTGLKPKDKKKLSFRILEETTGWIYDIGDFNSMGSTIYFSMPVLPFSRTDSVKTSVIVYYEGQEIYKSPYVYVVGLDVILDNFDLNKTTQVDADPTTSNNSCGPSQDLAGNSCSSSVVSKTTPKKNSRKRQHEKT